MSTMNRLKIMSKKHQLASTTTTRTRHANHSLARTVGGSRVALSHAHAFRSYLTMGRDSTTRQILM
jgi:hypothetical protein